MDTEGWTNEENFIHTENKRKRTQKTLSSKKETASERYSSLLQFCALSGPWMPTETYPQKNKPVESMFLTRSGRSPMQDSLPPFWQVVKESDNQKPMLCARFIQTQVDPDWQGYCLCANEVKNKNQTGGRMSNSEKGERSWRMGFQLGVQLCFHWGQLQGSRLRAVRRALQSRRVLGPQMFFLLFLIPDDSSKASSLSPDALIGLEGTL